MPAVSSGAKHQPCASCIIAALPATNCRSWLVHANVVHYSFAALMINQYGRDASGGAAARLGGLGVLEYYGFRSDDAWHHARLVWAFALAWTLLAWLALVHMRTSRR